MRYKQIFEVQINVWGSVPCAEYIKMRITNRRYQTKTVRTFWGTWSTSALRYLGVGNARKSTENKRSYKVRNLSVPDWWDFAYVLSTGYFPFLVGHGKDSELRKIYRGWKDTDRPLSKEDEMIQRDLYYEQFPTRSSCIKI